MPEFLNYAEIYKDKKLDINEVFLQGGSTGFAPPEKEDSCQSCKRHESRDGRPIRRKLKPTDLFMTQHLICNSELRAEYLKCEAGIPTKKNRTYTGLDISLCQIPLLLYVFRRIYKKYYLFCLKYLQRNISLCQIVRLNFGGLYV